MLHYIVFNEIPEQINGASELPNFMRTKIGATGPNVAI